ncbi:UNVERIFIED_CONTAM: hypothetical protein K2H54_037511 [Gekko kuhli]
MLLSSWDGDKFGSAFDLGVTGGTSQKEGTWGYKLSKDLDTFQANTVEPIWQLREDLRYRLSKTETKCEQQSCLESADAVLEQVELVKKQQKAILEKLHLERTASEKKLEDCRLEILTHMREEKAAHFHDIPPQLLALECPYPDLKASVFMEFHKLADEYLLKLQEKDEELKLTLSTMHS